MWIAGVAVGCSISMGFKTILIAKSHKEKHVPVPPNLQVISTSSVVAVGCSISMGFKTILIAKSHKEDNKIHINVEIHITFLEIAFFLMKEDKGEYKSTEGNKNHIFLHLFLMKRPKKNSVELLT
ncbi:hypothetical protein ACJX0J_014299 [Zea mays]